MVVFASLILRKASVFLMVPRRLLAATSVGHSRHHYDIKTLATWDYVDQEIQNIIDEYEGPLHRVRSEVGNMLVTAPMGYAAGAFPLVPQLAWEFYSALSTASSLISLLGPRDLSGRAIGSQEAFLKSKRDCFADGIMFQRRLGNGHVEPVPVELLQEGDFIRDPRGPDTFTRVLKAQRRAGTFSSVKLEFRVSGQQDNIALVVSDDHVLPRQVDDVMSPSSWPLPGAGDMQSVEPPFPSGDGVGREGTFAFLGSANWELTPAKLISSTVAQQSHLNELRTESNLAIANGLAVTTFTTADVASIIQENAKGVLQRMRAKNAALPLALVIAWARGTGLTTRVNSTADHGLHDRRVKILRSVLPHFLDHISNDFQNITDGSSKLILDEDRVKKHLPQQFHDRGLPDWLLEGMGGVQETPSHLRSAMLRSALLRSGYRVDYVFRDRAEEVCITIPTQDPELEMLSKLVHPLVLNIAAEFLARAHHYRADAMEMSAFSRDWTQLVPKNWRGFDNKESIPTALVPWSSNLQTVFHQLVSNAVLHYALVKEGFDVASRADQITPTLSLSIRHWSPKYWEWEVESRDSLSAVVASRL